MKAALVDRHQADLFYSLQLLLEDGLGIPVFAPVGMGWFDSGYWSFGRQHLGDQLARQFLELDARYELAADGSYYRTWDPAHPDRELRCVTLEQFHKASSDFGFVVATVQDNQAGFHGLARDHGLRYVLQVGNTRQQIDWGLDPLAIVSSEVPILGRGVRVHQPVDLAGSHRFRDPQEAEAQVASFVNLFPRLPDWALWERLRAKLPRGWTSSIYGIDGPDGNLHPVSAIGDKMASSGFGLHLKETGDGFGHVIHQWAAVGRPLIGRGRYYKGQLAEHLWQDGRTCIDLDLHDPEEAGDMVGRIWASPEVHAAMCRAIRAEFDTIDWAAELESVRELLA